MKNKNRIEEENRKMRYLRFIVDTTFARLHQNDLSILDSIQLIRSTKQIVLNLFPEKEAVYDLIYKPRFNRILEERVMSN
ncbi:hypothetical protein H8E88_23955 [candidate division KSB1 bacterium]|nr:hypothetical protein [candidate division KSB1 bacterium]MBL7093389.1 hypothetical protein [candidate division KSB1 bacterium]